MTRPAVLTAFPLVLSLAACGGGVREPETADSANPDDPQTERGEVPEEETATEEDSSLADGGGIPTKCHAGADPCTPDPRWVKKLCQDVYPAVALYLNQPSLPFTKAYLSRKTKAVNASGGATSGDEWLKFDEQVVLLYHRKSQTGGMQVSGANGGFDAMRWDGSCVTLDSTEVRMNVPPKPLHADIPWRYIGDDIQDALKSVDTIKQAYIARKQECKGAFSGSVSKKCVDADAALKAEIVRAIESGDAKLPVPERRP
jgi:hypothetical protein